MKRGHSVVVITIGGGPGSGTTTVARILQKRLRLRYVYTGDLFRGLAQEKGLSLSDFGKFVDSHPEIDKQLDMSQGDIAREGNVILEGRLAGFITSKEGIPALKVWLKATPNTRAQRVAQREGKPVDVVLKENESREAQEHERYLKNYDFDLDSEEIYDLVIDTDDLDPDQIADLICDYVDKIK